MINSLRLVNFKNFADETLHLGPFTLIVGANASGKSNIRDAFRFLHGASRGYSLAETLGGKYGEGGYVAWPGIRGAVNEVVNFGQSSFILEVNLEVPIEKKTRQLAKMSYSIEVEFRSDSLEGFNVLGEELKLGSEQMYSTMIDPVYALHLRVGEKSLDPYPLDRLKPALTQFSEELLLEVPQISEKDRYRFLFSAMATSVAFLRMRFLDLSPEQMKVPSFPGSKVLGESGENLPSVLQDICADPQRKKVLAAWLRELTPMDARDFGFPRDAYGRVYLQIQEANGREVSAYSASDGTLRFLGMLAALLNEHFEGLYFFEEIDNGIHPARLHLLLDLIERQTAKGKIQVVATTHSPDVLNLINDTTFENAVVVYRDEDSADAVIRRVAELPNARELRKSQGLGRLHAGGWMENILSFAEAEKEDEKGGE